MKEVRPTCFNEMLTSKCTLIYLILLSTKRILERAVNVKNRAAAVRCRSAVHRLPPRRSDPLPLSTRAASNTIAARFLSCYASSLPII